jgi:hypothetical protein
MLSCIKPYCTGAVGELNPAEAEHGDGEDEASLRPSGYQVGFNLL